MDKCITISDTADTETGQEEVTIKIRKDSIEIRNEEHYDNQLVKINAKSLDMVRKLLEVASKELATFGESGK